MLVGHISQFSCLHNFRIYKGTLIFNFAWRNSLLLKKAHHTPRDVAPLILALLGQNEVSAVPVLIKVLSDGTDKGLKVMVLIQIEDFFLVVPDELKHRF